MNATIESVNVSPVRDAALAEAALSVEWRAVVEGKLRRLDG